jgi:hypothetical protein
MGMTAWEQAMDSMREDEDMRAGKVTAAQKQDAEGYRYMGEMNPLKHLLPDVVQAELILADKIRQEGGR